MTFEITIPLYVLAYGPIVLAALATVGVGYAVRSYLRERKTRKLAQARLQGFTRQT